MPQIPGLPIDEPVALPQASPGQFGSAAESVARLGQESEQVAQGASEFERQLQFAHRQLQAKQAEIAIDSYMNQVYADLNKQTSVEGVDALLHDAQDPHKVGSLLAPYSKDPRLGQMVQIAWQQAQVGLEDKANVHKAHLITEGTKAADELNAEKTSAQAVFVAQSGADDATVKIFRDRYEAGLQAGKHAGVYTQPQIDAKMYQWDQGYMKDLAKAGMDSPDAATRQRTISELKAGGGHYAGMDATTRNALYDEAVERNERLSHLDETAKLDAATSHFHKLTDGWPYEAKVRALENDKWAKDNQFVDANGDPDRKILTQLGEDVDRQELRANKIQKDKDNEIYNKHITDVDTGKLSDNQIDKIVLSEGGSRTAATQLKAARKDIVKQELELNALSLQVQSLKRNQWQQDSYDTLGQVQLDIARGQRPTDEQIYGMLGRGKGKMSSTDVSAAIRMSHAYETDPTNKPFYQTILQGSFPPQIQGELVSEFDKYLQSHPTASSIEKQKAVDELTHVSNITRINQSLDAAGDVLAKPGIGQPASQRPPNAKGTQMFSDGKSHYVDADGVDLGVTE